MVLGLELGFSRGPWWGVPLADFVHPKIRSAYSLTEGAKKVDKVLALAKDAAMPAVAVTDHNNLFGALEFSQYAAKAGIQPIVGVDLAIRREEEGGLASASKLLTVDWLTLLAQDEEGYENLIRLVRRAHLEFKTGSTAALPFDRTGRPDRRPPRLHRQPGQCVGPPAGRRRGPAAEHQLGRLAELFEADLYRDPAPWRGQ